MCIRDSNNYDWTRYTYIRPSQLISGYSSYEPMQGLIDAYWDIDGKTIRPETVSYTHLDVYKRQLFRLAKGEENEF